MKEQTVQQSGCADTSCAVELGKLLSADKILVGTLNKLGDTYIINARIIDVEKGNMLFADNTQANSEADLLNAAKGIQLDLQN